jgi:hypothetical protein
MDKILAVAIAAKDHELIINSQRDLKELRRAKVRPYLRGLVQNLRMRGKKLGTHYEIIFRQRENPGTAGTFTVPADPTVILCMSTRVVSAAAAAFAPATNQPIVGIVSEPVTEGFDTPANTNICGVSARRVQTADACFERFYRTVPSLQEVKILVKTGYGPSNRALALVQAAAKKKFVATSTLDASTVANLETSLNGLAIRDPSVAPSIGVLVLPIDVCLGHAQDIIDLAQGEKRLPTFFPVTDWVKRDPSSALGGYGVPQRRCGELMAERVVAIWRNGNRVPPVTTGAPPVPTGFVKWIEAADDDLEFSVSGEAAEDLNIDLDASIPRV